MLRSNFRETEFLSDSVANVWEDFSGDGEKFHGMECAEAYDAIASCMHIESKSLESYKLQIIWGEQKS